MDKKEIMKKDPATWTEEEQIFILQNTDNSLKLEDEKLDQPEQDSDWQPDPDEVVDTI